MHRTRLWLAEATRARCSPTASACSASAPRSGCRRSDASTRGRRAARAGVRRRGRRSGLAARPADVNELRARSCGRRPSTRGDDGALRVGGVDVRDLAAEFGTPPYVLDEDDFRARAAPSATRSRRVRAVAAASTSTTPARRSSAPRSPAGSPRRASASTSAPAASSPSRCAPAFPASGSACTATTSRSPSCDRALAAGVGRIVVDSLDEIDRLARPRRRGRRRGRACCVRVTVGVEAHTHEYIATAHEDQKFGFSIAGGRRRRGRASSALAAAASCELVGLHCHIGSQIFDTGGFEVARAPGARPARRDRATSTASSCPELDLGGGFGIAYTTRATTR